MKSIEVSQAAQIKTLKRNIYFDDLPDALLREVSMHMQLREYVRGDVLFWEGDPCAGLHIIEKGSVKLYRVSPQGRQYILRVLSEGETCNEVPTFDGGTNPVNVEALDTCRVWVIEPEPLRKLLETHPPFAVKVVRNFGRNLRDLVHRASEMAFYQVTHRLARLINELPDSERQGPPWTQEQLAARLGTVREVVARSLKELEQSGAIKIVERKIQIADAEALRQWAQPDH